MIWYMYVLKKVEKEVLFGTKYKQYYIYDTFLTWKNIKFFYMNEVVIALINKKFFDFKVLSLICFFYLKRYLRWY